MRLVPDAPDVVASLDGAWIAVAGDRLRLHDAATRAERASAPLDGPTELAFVGSDRLLAVGLGEGRTRLGGFAVPSLELMAELELDGRLRPLAVAANRVLVATESLEQPRMVAITTKILVEPIALREPLLLAAAAPEDRLLAASRTRDAQLECWDPLVRRALFRLNLPLMAKAQQAGFAARQRLLWIASESGQLEVYRFSDGRLQARVDLGAPLAGAVGHPDSPRVVFATRPRGGTGIELTELDFQQGERRELTPPVTPTAFCIVEGKTAALVLAADGALTWMELAAAMPGDATRAAATTTTATTTPPPRTAGRTTARVAVADDWRAKLAASHPTAPARPRAANEATTERAEPHWRDRLCEWARSHGETPSLPEGSTVATLIERLALDAGPARALMLLYGRRLDGDGDGVAAATVAATIREVASGDDAAWDEALGRGLLAQLGLVRARDGKLRLSAAAARFLDGAPPRVTLLRGGAGDAELPTGNVRIDGGADPLGAIGARLAERHGYDVALVSVDTKPALKARLAEARMHGAWPLVDGGKSPASWIDGLDDGPTVVVVRGDAPESVAALPRI